MTVGEALPDEFVREGAGTRGGGGNGGVVPNEELVRLEGGDMSAGERGGVVCVCVSVDQMFCPGKEPYDDLPVTLARLAGGD